MIFALMLAMAIPADWVPARWNWAEPAALDLLKGTPVNCLLVKWDSEAAPAIATFANAASDRGIAALAIIQPAGDPADSTRRAIRAKVTGIVLEGDFQEVAVGRVRDAVADSEAVVIELTSRSKLKLGGSSPVVLATYQAFGPAFKSWRTGTLKPDPLDPRGSTPMPASCEPLQVILRRSHCRGAVDHCT